MAGNPHRSPSGEVWRACRPGIHGAASSQCAEFAAGRCGQNLRGTGAFGIMARLEPDTAAHYFGAPRAVAPGGLVTPCLGALDARRQVVRVLALRVMRTDRRVARVNETVRWPGKPLPLAGSKPCLCPPP